MGDEWYRIDLLFFHRGLRCLIVIDLKLGKLTHADAGQMNLYLNYAREHWTHSDESQPVGLISAPKETKPWPTMRWGICAIRSWPGSIGSLFPTKSDWSRNGKDTTDVGRTDDPSGS